MRVYNWDLRCQRSFLNTWLKFQKHNIITVGLDIAIHDQLSFFALKPPWTYINISNLQELNLALLITYCTKHTHTSRIHHYIMSTKIHSLLFFDTELLSLCFAFCGEERKTKINKIWPPHQEINFKKKFKKGIPLYSFPLKFYLFLLFGFSLIIFPLLYRCN